jgi:hypothetical protein
VGAPELADRVGRDAHHVGDAFGRVAPRGAFELREPHEGHTHALGPREPFGEDRLEHREQEECVGPGDDEVVRVRDLGRLGATRVDDDDLAPARSEPFEALLGARRGHDAPVRDERVRAEHEQVRHPVEIRHGEERLVAEHEVRRQHVGQLIDAGGREARVGAHRLREQDRAQNAAVRVHEGVAGVRAYGVRAMPVEELGEAGRGLVEGGVPRDARERAPAGAAHRLGDAIGVEPHVVERGGLGAEVPLAESVVAIALGAKHTEHPGLVVPHVHDEPTRGLAQHARRRLRLAHRQRACGVRPCTVNRNLRSTRQSSSRRGSLRVISIRSTTEPRRRFFGETRLIGRVLGVRDAGGASDATRRTSEMGSSGVGGRDDEGATRATTALSGASGIATLAGRTVSRSEATVR